LARHHSIRVVVGMAAEPAGRVEPTDLRNFDLYETNLVSTRFANARQ
jgi:hypothetical protein